MLSQKAPGSQRVDSMTQVGSNITQWFWALLQGPGLLVARLECRPGRVIDEANAVLHDARV